MNRVMNGLKGLWSNEGVCETVIIEMRGKVSRNAVDSC